MVLSMDEHYFPESDMDSLYCSLLMNFITVEVIDVLTNMINSLFKDKNGWSNTLQPLNPIA